MTQTPSVLQVHAFVSPDGGGNPAGVMILENQLSENEMQAIATREGYSETAFVSPGTRAQFRLDFFTPTRRIVDCGHATVGAFSVIRHRNPELKETTKEILTGIRNIKFEGDSVFMEQPRPAVRELSVNLYQSLFKDRPLVIGAWESRHDLGFLLFELDSVDSLRQATPDLGAIKTETESNDWVGVYLFVRSSGEHRALTRMFAPAYGIDEEAATGMAAGLLSPLLATDSAGFSIEQGRWMSPSAPSVLECQVLADRIWVGGKSKITG